MLCMPDVAADAIDLTSLPAEVVALVERLQQQAKTDAQELVRRGREITLALVKIDKLNFELARLERWKLGAKNWVFAGSALAGQRAAVVMSLVQTAKLNGLDPWAYLRDVLARLHTHPNHRLEELLPHRWRPA